MATSRSNEPWTAGASLFSGRPDPTWTVDEEAVEKLMGTWRVLPVTAEPPPPAPALGYRGVFLRSPAGDEWRAFAGAVEQLTPAGVMRRRDEGRRWEHALLKTAPKGVIPPGIT